MQIQVRVELHIQWQDDSHFHNQEQYTYYDDDVEDDVQVEEEVDDRYHHNSLNSMDHRMEEEQVDSMVCTRVDEHA